MSTLVVHFRTMAPRPKLPDELRMDPVVKIRLKKVEKDRLEEATRAAAFLGLAGDLAAWGRPALLRRAEALIKEAKGKGWKPVTPE